MRQKKDKDVDMLSQQETYSLMLFALYNLRKVPEYSCISELAYVLDKTNLFKLCEFFGGVNIKVPTKEELSDITKALYLYQKVDVCGEDVKDVLNSIGMSLGTYRDSSLMECYNSLKDTMSVYNFSGGSDDD